MGTIQELERIQNMVGRFILQVPASTSRVLAWMDAGLMPMAFRIQTRQAMYIWSVSKSKGNTVLMLVLREVLKYPDKPWAKSWLEIQKKIEIISNYTSKKLLHKALVDRAVTSVLIVNQVQSTSQPNGWFKLQCHLNDSKASRALCRFRAGNAQLGNRYKDKYGCYHVWCPWCMDRGVQVKLSEAHVVFKCPCVSAQRRSFGISEFFNNELGSGVDSIRLVFRSYLGGDGQDKNDLLGRGRSLAILAEAWLTACQED